MTTDRRIGCVYVLAAVLAVVAAVVLFAAAPSSATYPPLTSGGRQVAGPYELTTYRGDLIALGTVLVIASSVFVAAAVSRFRRRRL
ncbi:hypothetical protein [Williamsia sp. CHRR-6]|uniref:hypothetical protein n=1 Tax=Williamsia sp. CHRR-6 TaxID=2835871 RepID=UPI001BD991C3|nr:hypothetical protein [Williamsia sp. CHRR-6]MBT0565973.1 hypothetical protein [Williamsia sp. CHRR-6]